MPRWGPVAGPTLAGRTPGRIRATSLARFGDLRERARPAEGTTGVDNKLIKTAGEQLEGGHGAVFVMAEDAKADAIAARIRQLSNLKQYKGEITVGAFPADAQKLVKEHIKAQAAA